MRVAFLLMVLAVAAAACGDSTGSTTPASGPVTTISADAVSTTAAVPVTTAASATTAAAVTTTVASTVTMGVTTTVAAPPVGASEAIVDLEMLAQDLRDALGALETAVSGLGETTEVAMGDLVAAVNENQGAGSTNLETLSGVFTGQFGKGGFGGGSEITAESLVTFDQAVIVVADGEPTHSLRADLESRFVFYPDWFKECCNIVSDDLAAALAGSETRLAELRGIYEQVGSAEGLAVVAEIETALADLEAAWGGTLRATGFAGAFGGIDTGQAMIDLILQGINRADDCCN